MPETGESTSFCSSDPNLTEKQRVLAAETQATVKALDPIVKLMLSVSTAHDPALGINSMCSALAHEIAETFAIAVIAHGATEESCRDLIASYVDGIARGFETQLAWHKARVAKQQEGAPGKAN